MEDSVQHRDQLTVTFFLILQIPNVCTGIPMGTDHGPTDTETDETGSERRPPVTTVPESNVMANRRRLLVGGGISILALSGLYLYTAGSEDSPSEPTPTLEWDVETHEASEVEETSATLHGEVLVHEGDFEEATVSFEYSTADGTDSHERDAGVVTEPGPFSERVDGLEPGTEYQFRALAETDSDQIAGETQTVRTIVEREVSLSRGGGNARTEADGTLSYWSFMPHIQVSEPLDLTTDSTYRAEIEKLSTGEVVTSTIPPGGEIEDPTRFSFRVYDGEGHEPSNPQIFADEGAQIEVEIGGDVGMFASGPVFEEYVYRIYQDERLLGETRPHLIGTGYPGHYSYDGEEFRFHRHEAVAEDWTVTVRIRDQQANETIAEREPTVDGDEFVVRLDRDTTDKELWLHIYPPESEIPSLWVSWVPPR